MSPETPSVPVTPAPEPAAPPTEPSTPVAPAQVATVADPLVDPAPAIEPPLQVPPPAEQAPAKSTVMKPTGSSTNLLAVVATVVIVLGLAVLVVIAFFHTK